MTTATIDQMLTQYSALSDEDKAEFKMRMDDGWKPTDAQVELILRRSRELKDGTAKGVSLDEMREHMLSHQQSLRANAAREADDS